MPAKVVPIELGQLISGLFTQCSQSLHIRRVLPESGMRGYPVVLRNPAYRQAPHMWRALRTLLFFDRDPQQVKALGADEELPSPSKAEHRSHGAGKQEPACLNQCGALMSLRRHVESACADNN